MADTNELRAKNLEKTKIRKEKRENKIKIKQSKDTAREAERKTSSKEYMKKRTIKLDSQIAKINKKYDDKIKLLNTKITEVPKELDEKETKQLENSFYVKYCKKRIELITNSFEKKRARLKHKLDIAKITEEEFEIKDNELNIDQGSLFERWDSLIAKKTYSTTRNKLIRKINQLKKYKEKEVAAFEKRKKSTSPYSFIGQLKDSIKNVETQSVFGLEIREITAKISSHIRRYSMFYILAIIISIFAIGSHGLNLSASSFMTIMRSNTYILIIGLGMLLVIVGGYIDLSVGSMMGFMGAMSVIIYNQMQQNIVLTLIFILLLGASIGLVQGVLIGYFKMPAFIVTLGTMLLFQGLVLTVTKSQTLAPAANVFGNSSYIDFVTGQMPDIVIGNFHVFAFLLVIAIGIISVLLMWFGRIKKTKYGLSTDSSISFILKIMFILGLFSIISYYVAQSPFGLQYYLIYIMILIALFIFITQNTSFGRKVYAVGGNKRAAELSGINSARVTTYIFIITGVLVGFASIVFTAIASSAAPTVSGNGYELDVISAVFVGGASMAGGIGTIPGTIIGGLILGYINNGMLIMNLKVDMQKIVKAVVLLAAVGYDIYSNRKIG